MTLQFVKFFEEYGTGSSLNNETLVYSECKVTSIKKMASLSDGQLTDVKQLKQTFCSHPACAECFQAVRWKIIHKTHLCLPPISANWLRHIHATENMKTFKDIWLACHRLAL